MENKPRADIGDLIINTGKYIPEMPTDKVMLLRMETASILKKYDRGLAVNFISANFSANKHLTITGLNGMGDGRIKEYLEKIIADLDAELEKRDY